MTGGKEDYPGKPVTLIREYGEQAVRCCINTWNKLCCYPLTNTTEIKHRKRWLFFGPDVVDLEQAGACGQISKIAFGVSRRLTAKALRNHRESPMIAVNCWTHWNCGETCVRGWSRSVMVDVKGDCIAQFPDIIPATPHMLCCPLP